MIYYDRKPQNVEFCDDDISMEVRDMRQRGNASRGCRIPVAVNLEQTLRVIRTRSEGCAVHTAVPTARAGFSRKAMSM